MKKISTQQLLLPMMLFLLSCNQTNPGLDEANAGVLQLEQFQAWGGSYTAGFGQAGWEPRGLPGLHDEGQKNAFPVLLAQQFELTGRLTDYAGGWLSLDGSGRYEFTNLVPAPCEDVSPKVSRTLQPAHQAWNRPWIGPLSNFGLPHLSVGELDDPDLAAHNPFAPRLNLDQSYLEAMRSQRGGFSLLWIGAGDLLPFAMTGAANISYGASNPADFARLYAKALKALSTNRVGPIHILVGNLPDFTRFPFFQTLPHQYISTEDCNRSTRPIYYYTDQVNDALIAESDDLILLTAESKLGISNSLPGLVGLHRENPLPDDLVLDQAEVLQVRDVIHTYNSIIDSVATAFNDSAGYQAIAVADMFSVFENLSGGIISEGAYVSTEYLEGNIFEADGLYFSPKGNAFVANEFIRTINDLDEWEAQVPLLNLADYPGVRYP